MISQYQLNISYYEKLFTFIELMNIISIKSSVSHNCKREQQKIVFKVQPQYKTKQRHLQFAICNLTYAPINVNPVGGGGGRQCAQWARI